MIDAPISVGRMRALARPGSFQGCDARSAAVAALCASRAERLTNATGIAESLDPRHRAASPRPATDDLVASII
jgi:hypothetical protein